MGAKAGAVPSCFGVGTGSPGARGGGNVVKLGAVAAAGFPRHARRRNCEGLRRKPTKARSRKWMYVPVGTTARWRPCRWPI
jgi:hypothetical protein